MKLCVPVFTPPDDHAVEHGHSAGLRPPRMAQETRAGWGPCLALAGSYALTDDAGALDALEVPDPQEFVCRGVQGLCDALQLIGAHGACSARRAQWLPAQPQRAWPAPLVTCRSAA